MFLSLDYLYTPSADVDADTDYLVEVVGATLEWKIKAMATTVGCVRLAGQGPQVLLAGHLSGTAPIALYRVDDYADAVRRLRAAGVSLRTVELPPGPCAVFETPGGQRLGVYELVRPGVAERFAGRIDS